MRLLIVRHGKAEADARSGRDFDRELSARGEEQARYLAEALAGARDKQLARPVLIVSSRAVRARDTAAIIAAACDIQPEHDDRLLVDEPVEAALELIVELFEAADSVCVALVGHNPQLERLVSSFPEAGRADDAEPPALPLRTGECVAVDVTGAERAARGAPRVQGHRIARLRLPKGD